MNRGDILTCPVCDKAHTVTAKQAKHKPPLQLICDGPRAGARHRPVILKPVDTSHEFELEI